MFRPFFTPPPTPCAYTQGHTRMAEASPVCPRDFGIHSEMMNEKDNWGKQKEKRTNPENKMMMMKRWGEGRKGLEKSHIPKDAHCVSCSYSMGEVLSFLPLRHQSGPVLLRDVLTVKVQLLQVHSFDY